MFGRAEEHILNLTDADGKLLVLKLKVYHPIFFNATLDFIAKNPDKLVAMKYTPDDGKAMNIQLTPKSKKMKVAEFETEEECRKFYDYIATIVRNPKDYKLEWT